MVFIVTVVVSHVGGTIASQGEILDVNGTGKTVKGVAPDSTIFGIRVLGACGGGRASQFAEGLDYLAGFTFNDLIEDTSGSHTGSFNWDEYVSEQVALGRPENTLSKDNLVIDVVNMSLGGGQSMPSDPVNLAVHRLTELGVVVAAAAGNSGAFGTYSVHAPGSADKVISVGAAKTDIFIENVVVNFNGVERTLNAFAYKKGDFEEITTTALEGKEIVYASYGRETDYTESASGKVVIVERGRSSFYEKYLVAKNKGATGVIIINYAGTGDEAINEYYGELSAFNIPVYAIGYNSGSAIAGAAESGNKIEILNINHQDENRVILENNTVAGFSSLGPNYGTLNIKPDIIAPGENIIATVPDFYRISAGEPYRADNNSYASMSGTSMATPHVTGIAALLVQYARFELKTWDNPQIVNDQRTQELKVTLMNTADHTVYSGKEYDVVSEDLYNYSVFKRSTGLVSPVRALTYLNQASIYSEYDQQYLYLDASQINTTETTNITETNGIKTGLLNYGLLIGDPESNDPSKITSAYTNNVWEDRKTTIDNTRCEVGTGSDKFYEIKYVYNDSIYSESIQQADMQFTVTNMTYKSADGTEVSNNAIDQANFDTASNNYFINGNDGMYVNVPCGQKVDLQIEIAYMHPSLKEGMYEGYFNFRELTESTDASAFTLYDPLNYNYNDLGSSTSKKFVYTNYTVGNKDTDNPDYVTFSLPFAFKYVYPGVDFEFHYPFIPLEGNKITFIRAELYSDMEEPVRLFIKKAVTDADGDYVDANGVKIPTDADGTLLNPDDIYTEYAGVLNSHKFTDGFYKGLSFTVTPIRAMYAGDSCDVFYPNEDAENPTMEDLLGKEVITENIPAGCERKMLKEGLYELEYRYVLKGSTEVVTKNKVWAYATKEGAKISFNEFEGEQGDNGLYTIPGIYDIDANDYSLFDENGKIWIEGKVYDKKINIMSSLAPRAFNKYKIDQSKNSLFIHLNGSLLPNFKSELDELGNFSIGIDRKDILNGATTLQFRHENVVGVIDYPYNPFFAFVDKTTAHYRSVRLDSNKTVNTEQEIELYGYNFNRIVKGAFGIRLNGTCGVQTIQPSDELKEILDSKGYRIKISYTDSNENDAYVNWEIVGENVSGLSFVNDNVKLFDIKLTPVCESKYRLLREEGIRVAEISSRQQYEIVDTLNKSEYIMAFDATPLDQTNGLIPEGLFIEHNISGLTLSYLSTKANLKLIAPSGNVYYGKDKNVFFSTEEGNGRYILEVKSPGFLPSTRVIDIEFEEEGKAEIISITSAFSSSGFFGDFNADDVIDARDAYYLLMLDQSKDVPTVHQAFLSTAKGFKATFDAIYKNMGTVAAGNTEAVVYTEYGGFTMYDMALKLGYEDYYQNSSFPDFEYIEIDEESDSDVFIQDCIIIDKPHEFFTQDIVMEKLDGSASNGYKDGLVDSCELSKITSITIPEYMDSKSYLVTEFSYMINLKEYNNINGSIFTNLKRNEKLEKIQIVGGSLSGVYDTTLFINKENLKTVIARDIGYFGQFYTHSNFVETLDLSDNRITDLSSISDQSSLKYLYLANNELMNLDGVEKLYNLEVLDIRGNNIRDLEPLRRLGNLKYLILDDNQITDISPLEGLNLVFLSAKGNKISSIDALENMVLLESLNIADNNISDLSALEGKSLTQLYAQDNQISDIFALNNMTTLIDLNVSRNELIFATGTESNVIINNLQKNAKRGLIANYLQQKPAIHIENSAVYVEVGSTYIEEGGSVYAFGGKLEESTWEKQVVVVGLELLDTNTIGTYELQYYVIIAGIKSKVVTRTIHVVDKNFNSDIGTVIIK